MAGIYIRTEEQRRKHSIACKNGKTGKWKRTSQQNEEMSNRLKGRIFSGNHSKKLSDAMLKRWKFGDLKSKISLTRISNNERLKLIPPGDRLSRKKEKNGNWKGGKIIIICSICKKEFMVSPGRRFTAKFCSKKCLGKWIGKNLNGKNSSLWRGGITPINFKIRNSLEYKNWRKQVFERDNYTCVWCRVRGGWDKNVKINIRINADHIKPFSIFPELIFDLKNGQTLCVRCHSIKTIEDMIEIRRVKLNG